MTIVEALRQHNARVSHRNRWLIATDELGFIVYSDSFGLYGRHEAEVMIATHDEAEAVKVLLGEAEGEPAH